MSDSFDNDHISKKDVLEMIFEDKKAERRIRYIKFGLITAVALSYIGGMAFAFNKSEASSVDAKDYVSLVKISGEIGPGKSASAEVVNPLLKKAFEDKKSKGVILLVNSPGGTPVQSALINEEITALKKKTGKHVVVVGEDMVTSGAYLISVAADKIYVNRSTLAGSIGVISRSFGFTGLMDKIGVERRVMTAGESKNMLDPFGPQTDQDREKQAQLLAAIHTHFKDTVIQGRGKKLDLNTPKLFSGTVWTGEEAVKFGLVDGLGSLTSVMNSEFKVSNYKEFSENKPLLQSILSGVGVSIAKELVPGTTATNVFALPANY